MERKDNYSEPIVSDFNNATVRIFCNLTPEEKEEQKKRIHDATVSFLKKVQAYNNTRGVSNGRTKAVLLDQA